MKSIKWKGQPAEQERLLIIPGNDLWASFYSKLGEALASRAISSVALTLPGYHGEAPLEERGWEPLLRSLRDYWRKEISGPTWLCGHSLGAMTALLLALSPLPNLKGLILLEPMIAPYAFLARRIARAYEARVIASADRRFVNRPGAYQRVARLSAFPEALIEEYEAGRALSDLETPRQLMRELPGRYPLPFKRLAVPCLVVSGQETGFFLSVLQWSLTRSLPGARRVKIEGAAHWLANEQDQALASVISEFVGPQRGAGG